MDAKDIKDLILTIDKTSIEKVEIEKSDIKIMITKKVINESNNVVSKLTENTEVKNIESKVVETGNEDNKTEIGSREYSKSVVNDEDTYIVKSPIVGTFYEAASPDSPAFVKVGDIVEKGQTLCIIEAMKIMNEIECEVTGEIIEIFASDEDIVEYGQPLMKIRG